MKLSNEQEQIAAAQWAQQRANMKAYLKSQSKNQLIQIVFEQLDLFIQERQKVKELTAQLASTEGAPSEAKN